MRQIEIQMIAAVHNNQNWQSANTSVITDANNVSEVYLHGNKIAEIDDDSMTIFDGGYQSATTKARLNALCDEFCIEGEGVFQKNNTWYVKRFVGQVGDKKVFQTTLFTNGYVFS